MLVWAGLLLAASTFALRLEDASGRGTRWHQNIVHRAVGDEGDETADGTDAPAGDGTEEKEEEGLSHEEKLDKIQENADKMDEVNGTLFEIGCVAKHTRDLKGEAFEMAEDKEKEFPKIVKQLQDRNVNQLEDVCKQDTGKGYKACQDNCAAYNHGAVDDLETMARKEKCQKLCDSTHENYGKNCMAFADHLRTVYETNEKNSRVGNQCSEEFCKEYQNVVRETTEEAQQKLLESNCDGRCETREGEEKEACKKRCLDGCEIDRLNQCVIKNSGNKDITNEFCAAYWEWITTTGEQPTGMET